MSDKTGSKEFNDRLEKLKNKKKPKKSNKKKMRKTTKIGITGFILLLVLVGYVLITNLNTTNAEKSRDGRLAIYEVTKMQVMDDLEGYLSASTEEEFNTIKRDARFTQELKKDLFGEEFNYTKLQNYDSVNFLDVQYSFEYDGVFKVFLLSSLEKDGETKIVSFVVSIRDGKAFDMIAF